MLITFLIIISAALSIIWLQLGYSIIGWSLFIFSALFLYKQIPLIKINTASEKITFAREILILLAIILAASILRLWSLDQIPPACWFDEAENGLETLRILQGDLFCFSPRNNGRGALQFYWSAPFFLLFGPEIFSLRLASAVLGILTIPAAWLLFRELAGKKIALLGTAFLAISHWHITISRIGFDAVMPPFFDILVIYSALKACRQRSWFWFGLSGLLAGLANYGYSASRLTPALLIAGYAFWLRREDYTKKNTKGLIVAATIFILTIIPLLHYGIKNPQDIIHRGRQVSVISNSSLAESIVSVLKNTRNVIRMFHEKGDRNPRHNMPGRPMLDPIAGLMFLAGILAIIKNGIFRTSGFIILWLIAVLFCGGVLTRPAPHGLRTLSAIVPIAYLTAIGIERLVNMIRLDGRRAPVFMTILLLSMLAFSIKTYFMDYANSPQVRAAFSPHAYAVGKYIKENIPENETVMISTAFSPSIVRFVSNKPAAKLMFTKPDTSFQAAIPDNVIVAHSDEGLPGITGIKYLQEMITPKNGGDFIVLKRDSNKLGD